MKKKATIAYAVVSHEGKRIIVKHRGPYVQRVGAYTPKKGIKA